MTTFQTSTLAYAEACGLAHATPSNYLTTGGNVLQTIAAPLSPVAPPLHLGPTAFTFGYTALTMSGWRPSSALPSQDERVTAVHQVLTPHLIPAATSPIPYLWASVPPPRTLRYRRCWRGPAGVLVAAGPTYPHDRQLDPLYLTLGDDVVAALGSVGLRSLVADLASTFTLSCNRLDLTFADCAITVDDIKEALASGCVNGPFKGRRPPHQHCDDGEFRTTYIGAAKAERRLRVYDRRGSTRLELVCRHRRAHRVFQDLVLGSLEGAALAQRAKGIVVDFTDFAYPGRFSAGQPLRLPWWGNFVGGASVVALPIPRSTSSLDGSRSYLIKKRSKRFAMVALTQPEPLTFFVDLLAAGWPKISPLEGTEVNEARVMAGLPLLFFSPPPSGASGASVLAMVREMREKVVGER